jgi:hypothetical protein
VDDGDVVHGAVGLTGEMDMGGRFDNVINRLVYFIFRRNWKKSSWVMLIH